MKKTETIRGDFKILDKVGKNHFRCQCIHCGAIKEYASKTVYSGRMRCSCPHEVTKVCRQCNEEFKTTRNALFCSKKCKNKYYNSKRVNGEYIKKAENPHRKINSTTRMLVCVYTAEGLSVKEIAAMLKRTESTVRKILSACKKNGRYEFYKNNSPILGILEKRKRRCT